MKRGMKIYVAVVSGATLLLGIAALCIGAVTCNMRAGPVARADHVEIGGFYDVGNFRIDVDAREIV